MAQTEEQTVVQAEIRTERGKNDARRLRAAGKIPVTIYGGEGEPVAAAAKLGDLAAIIRSKHGISSIFRVAINGEETEVMFHDRQIDPMKGRLLHADLKRIVRGQKLTVSVPVELVGEPIGVSQDGGILDHVTHTIEISCRPSQIPDAIQADVTNLHVGDVLHASDLKPGEGIEVVSGADAVIATVKRLKLEVEGAVLPTPTGSETQSDDQG